MRTLTLVLLTSLLAMALIPGPAAAAPDVCIHRTVDAGLVVVTGDVGGVGCVGATIETCTLYHDPDYPSTPVWRCRTLISTP